MNTGGISDINPNSHILVSVVVPVFNVEDYIEGCVNSIRDQTHQNIEIVLVDDGSTDSRQWRAISAMPSFM